MNTDKMEMFLFLTFNSNDNIKWSATNQHSKIDELLAAPSFSLSPIFTVATSYSFIYSRNKTKIYLSISHLLLFIYASV